MAHTVENGKIRRNRLLSFSCKRPIHVYLRALLDKYDLVPEYTIHFTRIEQSRVVLELKKKAEIKDVESFSDIAEPKISERCDKITYLVNKRV